MEAEQVSKDLRCLCDELRQEILAISKRVIGLKEISIVTDRPALLNIEQAKTVKVSQAEMISNIMLAYRHLEDATMRMGRVLEAQEEISKVQAAVQPIVEEALSNVTKLNKEILKGNQKKEIKTLKEALDILVKSTEDILRYTGEKYVIPSLRKSLGGSSVYKRFDIEEITAYPAEIIDAIVENLRYEGDAIRLFVIGSGKGWTPKVEAIIQNTEIAIPETGHSYLVFEWAYHGGFIGLVNLLYGKKTEAEKC